MNDSSASSDIVLRDARTDDAGAIDRIYNHYVQTSTCTFQTEPAPPEERVKWLEAIRLPHQAIVAERDGEVVGWGTLARFHERCGYRLTVTDSVYITPGAHRRGIGRLILDELLQRARASDVHVVMALIVAGHEASIALHRAFGFVEVGHLREVGRKFEQWLDVIYMELLLDAGGNGVSTRMNTDAW